MAHSCAFLHILFCCGFLHPLCCAVVAASNSTYCFWFPLVRGNFSFELTVNYTVCPPCLTRQAAAEIYEPGGSLWCRIGNDRCSENDHDELGFLVPPGLSSEGHLTSVYAWLAFLSFSYTAQFHPEIFGIGNVSRVYVDIKHQFICAVHDGQNTTLPHHDNISATFQTYYQHQVDGGNWFHLEWLRPFFSSWLVLNVSWFLRRSPVSRVSVRVFQTLRPTQPQLQALLSSRTSAVLGMATRPLRRLAKAANVARR
uniref:GP3 n=1 Tax=Porcine reproductive and respiratory syndrome virus TaxID=28344 RepID=A0A1B0Z9Q7_PRRSV|nr:GP3 [Porcine reproductive and respiratory syndrome virus]ANP24101.1 GP3 [Porcine reproductive and respiratory syndrome virus]ANP24108.1 GP3 [Porcine reproductive and respiratory syndrome virus]ANP24115.1 GP3 [Porcine reproductive and respiratory syndrome virus]